MYLDIILTVAGLECLAVSCFTAGYLIGRGKRIKSYKVPSITLDDDLLDPITPEDQMLDERLEKEAKEFVKEDEDN